MRKFLLPTLFAAALAFGMTAPPRASAQWSDQATVNRYGPAYNGGYYYYPAYRYPYAAPTVYYRTNYYPAQAWDEHRWDAWRQWNAMHNYRR